MTWGQRAAARGHFRGPMSVKSALQTLEEGLYQGDKAG